ncbi:beta-galactosidase [Bacillus licheniformis]|nr:beta-galactosidase [Bacillus licheniformis]
MESTPSMTNWQDVSKLKRPGMHELSSLQAVAHGSDTVQYFQWRKSRGSSENSTEQSLIMKDQSIRAFSGSEKLGEKLESWRTSQGRQSNPRPRLYLTGRIAGLWKMPKVRAISECIMNGPPNRL